MKYRNLLMCRKQGKFLPLPLADRGTLRCWAPCCPLVHIPSLNPQTVPGAVISLHLMVEAAEAWRGPAACLGPHCLHREESAVQACFIWGQGKSLMTKASRRTESKREVGVFRMDLLSISFLPMNSSFLVRYTHISILISPTRVQCDTQNWRSTWCGKISGIIYKGNVDSRMSVLYRLADCDGGGAGSRLAKEYYYFF